MMGSRVGQATVALTVAALAYALSPVPDVSQQASQNMTSLKVRDPEGLAQQLSELIRCRTVGNASAPGHVSEHAKSHFLGALQVLEESFPAAFRELAVTRIAEFSLVLKYQGSDPGLKPFALLSHIDVVPADEDEGTSAWSVSPFGGVIKDGFVWGRGAVDLKGNVVAILHAVNQLVEEGLKPRRSFYVALGHDEEVGGLCGAAEVVRWLKEGGVQLKFVLDEGGVIIRDGLPPLTHAPIALVGTAEKDYSVMRIDVASPGGHSSMPPVDGSSVAATLARMLLAVDRTPPCTRIQSPTKEFLHAMAEVAPVRGARALLRLAHHWPLSFVIARLLALSPSTNALVATTVAVTSVQTTGTNNVLPQHGTALLNFRHLPGHTASQGREYLQGLVPNHEAARVNVTVIEDRMTGHVSPAVSPQFDLIARAIRETPWPGSGRVVVAPYLVVGGTDSKHYAPLARNIYRFQPMSIDRRGGDLDRIHGTDERISVRDLEAACTFFLHFVSLASRQ
mmetsp:Transcript_17488/g.52473  ORF Transcript_17488/g.52473 Transcript_17488/m.52473 type:complete len:508 (+) Transcript_17488:152-1675(+)|eukprot:CAMPEP_0206137850 /NCGR_PEP_ID=MMETSP1473-20131121/2889_1 /ASSEMBLY_ACC=CAM_ASM_001109 /TAXON_ID=1461547 /ORGANISM="Stichococcus sp, Strain RCC1054" /LENGTH=507 /DNA_ID=CAMNT_0053531103 /DNA_START=85 /DNA_END=1608 /DNA_ORIENTATION=+